MYFLAHLQQCRRVEQCVGFDAKLNPAVLARQKGPFVTLTPSWAEILALGNQVQFVRLEILQERIKQLPFQKGIDRSIEMASTLVAGL